MYDFGIAREQKLTAVNLILDQVKRIPWWKRLFNRFTAKDFV